MKGDIKTIGLVAVGKLILHPVLALLVVQGLPTLDPSLKVAMVLIAAAPMMSIFPVLGERFGCAKACSAALAVTTLASFVTLNLVLWVLLP